MASRAYAVIGLGFGDEGKGLVVDYLSRNSRSDVFAVVRFSGGQQAGHTVVFNGIRHVFSNFSAGTFAGVDSMFAKECTVDPIGIMNEHKILLEKFKDPNLGRFGDLLISHKCPVTTPYDVLQNYKDNSRNNHGTCGLGVGATKAREEAGCSLWFGDLFNQTILDIKLRAMESYYKTRPNLDRFLDAVMYVRYVDQIKSYKGSFADIPQSYDIIYESSQGLLLDEKIGFFPHVTRSTVGHHRNFRYRSPIKYFVTRAYQTRHGNGPMTNENIPHNIHLNENETNVNNKYQGEFRRTLLDLDLLLYGLSRLETKTINDKLVITCLDHVKDDLRLTHNGSIKSFNDEKGFVDYIAFYLKFRIDYVLISKSDESKNIIKYHDL